MTIQSTSQYKNNFNHMKVTEQAQKKSAKELASGKKVNSAADDAVALSISQKLMKEAKSLKAGSNNISYGIDATNIMDGGLAGISSSLGDIEQNTVRAMNGLYSESDRAILQEANKQTVETINHSINQADYNGKKLLDGSTGDMNIYTGTASAAISEADAKSAMAGLENFDISGNPDKISKEAIDDTYSKLSDMRSQIGAETNGLEHAYSVNNNTEENVTAAQSRKEDTDFAKSVSKMKSSQVVNQAQTMVLKNQMKDQENLVNKMFQ